MNVVKKSTRIVVVVTAMVLAAWIMIMAHNRGTVTVASVCYIPMNSVSMVPIRRSNIQRSCNPIDGFDRDDLRWFEDMLKRAQPTQFDDYVVRGMIKTGNRTYFVNRSGQVNFDGRSVTLADSDRNTLRKELDKRFDERYH